MVYQSLKDLVDAVKPVATVMTDRVTVTAAGGAPSALVDSLAESAVFGREADVRGTARWIIRQLAAAAGIRPASIHDLYMAMGRGDAAGFTVPAINVRAMAYETARAVIRAAKSLDAGAFILEIARSEIGYTEQRPHEYSAVMLAAALREGFSGPLFIQGDHVQTNAKKYAADPDREVEAVRELIREEIAGGFYNIDIDTSTLVDLSKTTLDEQQKVNCELAAEFTALVRTDVKIDLETLRELSRVAREEFRLSGAVQHGASTLPPEAFGAFPEVGASEIHLATDFQNMMYEHAQFPKDLKDEMYAWIRAHATEERKPKDTEEQFIYKARKKALGPFKSRLWGLPQEPREAIGKALEERFRFLMGKLRIDNTASVVARFVSPAPVPFDRDAEVVAAGGKITAAEKKAEGLAD
jgi:fructose/tagatose bisphosphate aldolase